MATNVGVNQAMVTTGFELPGYRVVKSFGLVRGITVRSRSIFGTLGASLQTVVGGNITHFRGHVRADARAGARSDAGARHGARRECRDRRAVRRDGSDAGRDRSDRLRHGGAGGARPIAGGAGARRALECQRRVAGGTGDEEHLSEQLWRSSHWLC